jgi:hypothetical protein
LRNIKIQVVKKDEAKGLEYVQKHIDLGWKAISKFSLGDEVYFVNLIWESDEDPILPSESPLNKNQ